MDNSTGGTAVKRIQLKVESETPSLGAIDATISRMTLLSGQIGKVNAGLLQMNVLMGGGARSGISSGTGQAIKQMNQMGLSAGGISFGTQSRSPAPAPTPSAAPVHQAATIDKQLFSPQVVF